MEPPSTAPNKDQDDATPRRTNKVARVLNSVRATCSAHKVIKSLIPVRRFWCVLFLLHRESPLAVGISVVAGSQDDGRDATVSPKMVADRNYIIIDSWPQELSNRRCWRRPCWHTTLVPCIILLFYFWLPKVNDEETDTTEDQGRKIKSREEESNS